MVQKLLLFLSMFLMNNNQQKPKKMDYDFIIFADYHQIILEDSKASNQLHVEWTEDDVKTRLIVDDNRIIISTARDMEVPFRVEVSNQKPDIKASEWDHVVLCSINVPSGILNISGPTDYIEDANKISLSPGIYGAAVCFKGLKTISDDGLSGNDTYTLKLWKEQNPISKRVVKKFTP